MEIVATVLAVLAAPLITFGIGVAFQRRSMQYERKYNIFRVLMAERATVISAAAVGALNLIDVEFKSDRAVRAAYAAYYELVSSSVFRSMDAATQAAKTKTLRSQLLLEMIKVLRVQDHFDLTDLERGYLPEAISQPRTAVNAIMETLKNSVATHGGIPVSIMLPQEAISALSGGATTLATAISHAAGVDAPAPPALNEDTSAATED